MIKKFAAALAAVCSLACAGQAHAAKMVATLSGVGTDQPFDWSVEIRYDTDLLATSAVNDGWTFTTINFGWNESSGTPSPVSYAKGVFFGYGPGGDVQRFELTDLTSFNIKWTSEATSGLDLIRFDFTAPGSQFAGGIFAPAGSNPIVRPQAVSGDPWFGTATIEGTSWGNLTPTNLRLTAVPEPATWAMMIGGFFGAGTMVRRRRAALAA